MVSFTSGKGSAPHHLISELPDPLILELSAYKYIIYDKCHLAWIAHSNRPAFEYQSVFLITFPGLPITH
jgi:hypothetical protein